ncbi:MAG: LysR family transcriptional regulator [Lachnospiraceae bacterium]|nr:LysR family transcriptional regulator [Lachnospiraceae bacterium]
MEQNLNQYKIFYEVARLGNISKAAESLYISQPAVSKSISNLETALSSTLFIRSKRGVKLTEEGKTLFEHLETAFDNIELAEKKLRRMEELGIGQLRIGASTSLCKHILLPYLQNYIEQNPHVKVSIDCKPTFETLQQMKNDKIDIGLICETELDKGYNFIPFRSIHDTFVATQTYLNNLSLREGQGAPLENDDTQDDGVVTRKKSRKSKDTDFAGYIPNMAGLIMFSNPNDNNNNYGNLSEKEILEKCNLMLLDQGNISRIYIDEYMKSNNIKPSQILEINNMDLLIDFAAIGMGVAGVVKEFISDYLDTEQVIEIPIDYKIEPRTVGFVYNENLVSSPASKFIDFIKQIND